MSIDDGTTLEELGERRIVKELISEYCVDAGDDCAIVALGVENLVITTDPVPEPAAKVIGGDEDPYWMGWLLVVINASDLAAGGAKPVAFVSAISAPPDYPATALRRFLRGTADACENEGLRYVGGNLREDEKLSAVGTAVGTRSASLPLARSGATPGDVLVSVGGGGVFWRDALMLRNGQAVDNENSPVFRPRSQLEPMRRLFNAGVVRAAIDNSDGLLPSLKQLAVANKLDVILELDLLDVSRSGEVDVDPARLWLGWGDWNVIVAIREADWQEASDIVADVGFLQRIGHFESGAAGLLMERGSKRKTAPRLESERFAKDSWFREGVDRYIELLLNAEIP